MMMNKITVLPDQTIYDLAVQEYGSVEAVFWIMEDNPGVNLSDDLTPGIKLIIRDDVMDKALRDHLKELKYTLANGGGDDPLVGAFNEGFSDGFKTDNE